ncbi:Hypothetical protein Nlim_1732 [Candidatus Nitrosarchaeum limnium SFB1]|uniref:Uncharacterized protein n=1 Tax=Candidatus Nitrosarchaeum limnium SFB1 TaxID=886738 RepID=F3KMI2_9ARCH|nr:Hypothetical protein Nlim_1732 [Candidatus Nitrosarchaeum limnium SFB1]
MSFILFINHFGYTVSRKIIFFYLTNHVFYQLTIQYRSSLSGLIAINTLHNSI